MRFAPGFLKFSTSLGFRRVCASRETISLFPTRFYSMAQPEATKSIAEDRIQLFSLGTPNGFKASVALEELGLPYDLHRINIGKGDQFTDSFKAVNPNSKIPAITDPNGPDGKPFNVFESGAILLYLAEKTGKLLPSDQRRKWEAVQWLFWQMAGVGPMFGQFGHFTVYAPEKLPYAIERYSKEVRRLLAVLDKQLEGHTFIVGDEYTVADIATWPWVEALQRFYKAGDVLNLAEFTNVVAWLERCLARPASQRGLAALAPKL
eukprot:TRINITY_DN363_c0_g3_i2.p1 TRINITY_DN363_c0_g3~~TRINITY_DN363_c0_g3_i2.p1  ORF type:complete len:277 (+),score=86.89 TRINITY_DN363_c0_g3_i2:44-832(+)